MQPAADPATAPTATSLPLREIMRGLAADMERVYAGVWTESYDSVAAAALSVADHPKVGPEQRAAIAGALGDDFRRFASHDMEVHDAGIALREAALEEEMERVLQSLDRVQRGCASCHTGFRERLRPVLGARP